MSDAGEKEPKKMLKILIRVSIGIAVGAVLGFALYRFVGCRTGTCPITANPWTSMAYGAVMGLLMALV